MALNKCQVLFLNNFNTIPSKKFNCLNQIKKCIKVSLKIKLSATYSKRFN